MGRRTRLPQPICVQLAAQVSAVATNSVLIVILVWFVLSLFIDALVVVW